MELKNIKCLGCHQKWHVVSDCPEKKHEKPARVMQTDLTVVSSIRTILCDQPVESSLLELPKTQGTGGPKEPWMSVLTARFWRWSVCQACWTNIKSLCGHRGNED